MKMKKTDIGVVVVMYAVCAFFYYMTRQLKAESQVYPLFTITLLFGLTTLYLLQMLFRARKNGVESGVDEVFNGFEKLQFFVCFICVVSYLVLVNLLGFFSATILFMLAVLIFLRVPVKHIVITVVALNLMIYVAFVQFLGVRLPSGILF